MKKHNKYILGFLLVISIILIAFWLITSNIKPSIDYKHEKKYEDTLIVVADYKYPPFSFIDEEGKIQGYDIELTYMLADKMEMNVDLRLMQWPEPIDIVVNGDADIVLGLEYKNDYLDNLELSTPVQINEFVVFGKEEFYTINELYDKRIGALENSISHKLFLKPLNLQEDARFFSRYEDGFQAILEGEIDYLVGRYSVGRRVLSQEGITSIDAIGDVVINNAFCIGMQKGDIELKNKLNEAIKELNKEGSLNKLTNKWLGHFVEVITIEDFFIRYSKEILIVFVVFLLGFLSIYKILKTKKNEFKRIAEKNLQEYQKLLINITNKLYARIYQYNITKNSIDNEYTREILINDGFSPDMTYTEIIELDVKKHIEENFKNTYINEFSAENILKQYENNDYSFSFQYLRLLDNNEYIWFQDIVHIFLHNAKDIHIIVFRENIDSEKRRENLLIEKAKMDSATGFYNKLSAEEAIKTVLNLNRSKLNAFIVLDLDEFKNVNDTYGHVFGDKAIKTITNSIKTIFRERDILGRIGGDEFVIFMPDIKNTNTARAKGYEICKLVRNISFEENQKYRPTISVGITLSKKNDTFQEMYQRADKALYAVKNKNRNNYILYEDMPV